MFGSQFIEDAADLSEAQALAAYYELSKDIRQSGPFMRALAVARADAANAVRALLEVDPHDWKQVQSLQNEVARYRDLVTFCRQVIDGGLEAERNLTTEMRQAVLADLAEDPTDL